ncbi:MAG: hypothetical protein COC06_07385 [Bacteroidales bacterium]|nr:MAG: hypothetical protein COC06_07385 [Bacteroidales bacterium]
MSVKWYKTFSQTKEGEINGKQYSFRTKGFFQQHTQIFNQFDLLIGEIQYNSWMTKANITLGDQLISWKYDNIWNTKWSMTDSDGLLINSTNSTTSGSISSNSEDELLLLIGLFVTNYYKQMTIVVMLAVFVPLWTTLFN